MPLRDIIQRKEGAVHAVAPGASLGQAWRREGVEQVLARRVGSPPEVEDSQGRVGILAGRECRRAPHRGAAPWESPRAAEVMSGQRVRGRLEEDIDATLEWMSRRRVHGLPVMDAETLAGVVPLGDTVEVGLHAARFPDRPAAPSLGDRPEQARAAAPGAWPAPAPSLGRRP